MKRYIPLAALLLSACATEPAQQIYAIDTAPIPASIETAPMTGTGDKADDPAAKLAEIEKRLNQLRSPYRTAETFWIEDIIEPHKTRPLLCDFANLAAPLRTPGQVSFGMRP